MRQCFRGMIGIQHVKKNERCRSHIAQTFEGAILSVPMDAIFRGLCQTFEGAILSVPMVAIFRGLMVDVSCLALRHYGITALIPRLYTYRYISCVCVL